MNIVEEIRAGNKAVFERTYHEYHQRLYFFVLKRTSSVDMAEEVIQQTFIKLWETRQNLSSDFPIAIQLARITRTMLIDVLRRKAVERRALNYIGTQIAVVSSDDPILEKELNQKVKTAIDSLPPVCKTIFMLNREDGLSYKQIARQLSISPKTVENQISKALKIMREAVSLCIILSSLK